MDVAPAAAPVWTAPSEAPEPGAWGPAGPANVAGPALIHLAGAAALPAALAAACTAKRRLGIDVVAGADMLPDPRIGASIGVAVFLLGW